MIKHEYSKRIPVKPQIKSIKPKNVMNEKLSKLTKEEYTNYMKLKESIIQKGINQIDDDYVLRCLKGKK